MQTFFINKAIRGSIIISKEGINGTISAKKINLDEAINKIKKIFNFDNFDSVNYSKCNYQPFHRGKAKIKNEVVPMGIKIYKRKSKNHIDPVKWNKLIRDKNTFLLDARKPFEHEVGTFKKSINPKVDNFREFPNYLKNLKKNKTIAMFCTGGIRCEKASSFLLNLGKKNVYHLHGGILKYLEHNKNSKSWKGECFVFDNRVSLNKNLKTGSYVLCHACRMPLCREDKDKKEYIEGEACHLCYNIKTEEQKKKYRMRNNQIKLQKES